VTEPSSLERDYRRLLAWYPRAFRAERGDEMLVVLMACAREGQRHPSLAEVANVIRSALGMRLRPRRPRPGNQTAWADALALFSLVAPLFLLLTEILEVALPYRVPGQPLTFVRWAPRLDEMGGLWLLSERGFVIAVGAQVLIAALVLLGLRRTALAAILASTGYWIVARYWLSDPLMLLTTGFYLLEATALIASPGPRYGRHLVNWGHGVLLLLTAAAVQISTLTFDTTGPQVSVVPSPRVNAVYLVISVMLAVAAVSMAVTMKVNRYVLPLLAVLLYPYALQLAFTATGGNTHLIGNPTPFHLASLYLPLLVFAWAAIVIPILRAPAATDETGLA